MGSFPISTSPVARIVGFICLLFLSVVCRPILWAEDLEKLDKQGLDGFWNRIEDQARCLSVDFTYTCAVRDGQPVDRYPSREISLRWDMRQDWISGSNSFLDPDDGQPVIFLMIKGKERCWISAAETDLETGVPTGTYSVDTCAIGSSRVPPQSVFEAEFRMPLLKYTFMPFHKAIDIESRIPPTWQMNLSSVEKTSQTRYKISYSLIDKEKKTTVHEYVYDIDLSPRFHFVSAHATYRENGKVTGDRTIEYGKPLESNDSVLFPHQMRHVSSEYNKIVLDETIQFKKAQTNPTFAEADFKYIPPYGSRITDIDVGISHRVGYPDPDAALGSDTDKMILARIEEVIEKKRAKGKSKPSTDSQETKQYTLDSIANNDEPITSAVLVRSDNDTSKSPIHLLVIMAILAISATVAIYAIWKSIEKKKGGSKR